ncbi:MAG: hypothetical protein ACRDNE_02570 [Gaiellaceae bacterium]
MQDKACHNGTVRRELFIHTEEPILLSGSGSKVNLRQVGLL